MIGYVTLGTSNLAQSSKFYDALAERLSWTRFREFDGGVHRTALAHGGSDEGAPGERFEGFYAAYFRASDGNKLNAFTTANPVEKP